MSWSVTTTGPGTQELIDLAKECDYLTRLRNMVLSVFNDSLAVKFLRNGTYASAWLNVDGAFIAYSPCMKYTEGIFNVIQWYGYDQAWYYRCESHALAALLLWDMERQAEPSGYYRKLRSSEYIEQQEATRAKTLISVMERDRYARKSGWKP